MYSQSVFFLILHHFVLTYFFPFCDMEEILWKCLLADKSFLACFPNNKIILFHYVVSDALKAQALCNVIQIVPILSFPVLRIHTVILYFLMACLTLNYRPLLYIECLRSYIIVRIYWFFVLHSFWPWRFKTKHPPIKYSHIYVNYIIF